MIKLGEEYIDTKKVSFIGEVERADVKYCFDVIVDGVELEFEYDTEELAKEMQLQLVGQCVSGAFVPDEGMI